jgi:hypothetical protein
VLVESTWLSCRFTRAGGGGGGHVGGSSVEGRGVGAGGLGICGRVVGQVGGTGDGVDLLV